MVTVLGCIDRSAYADAVCDYAAWLAGPLAADLDILHVEEAADHARGPAKTRRTDRLLQRAGERLADHGVRPRHLRLDFGSVTAAATAAAADITVLGKRGERSDQRRDALGSNAAALLRDSDGHLCLVSQIYLPIRRALVLIGDDPQPRGALETVAGHPALRNLELDVVLLAGADRGGGPTLARARAQLGERADVFPLAAPSPDAAAAHRLAERPADLIVLSRALLLAQTAEALPPLEARTLWAFRAPLLIC